MMKTQMVKGSPEYTVVDGSGAVVAKAHQEQAQEYQTGTLFACVLATRTGTRFVSHHRTREGAERAAVKYNKTFPRGTRAEATGVNVYE